MADAVMYRCRDTRRARDYDGLVHQRSAYSGAAYTCDMVPINEAANHGVYEDEPTTCFWCIQKRPVHGRWRGS